MKAEKKTLSLSWDCSMTQRYWNLNVFVVYSRLERRVVSNRSKSLMQSSSSFIAEVVFSSLLVHSLVKLLLRLILRQLSLLLRAWKRETVSRRRSLLLLLLWFFYWSSLTSWTECSFVRCDFSSYALSDALAWICDVDFVDWTCVIIVIVEVSELSFDLFDIEDDCFVFCEISLELLSYFLTSHLLIAHHDFAFTIFAQIRCLIHVIKVDRRRTNIIKARWSETCIIRFNCSSVLFLKIAHALLFLSCHHLYRHFLSLLSRIFFHLSFRLSLNDLHDVL